MKLVKKQVKDLLKKIENTWCASYNLRSSVVYILILKISNYASKAIFYYPKTSLIKPNYQLDQNNLLDLCINPTINKEDEDNFNKDYTKHLLNGGDVIHENFHLKASK